MAARTVLLNLVGQDRVSRTLRRVRQEVDRTGETINRFSQNVNRAFANDRFQAFARGLGQVVKAGAKLGALGASAGLAAVQVAQLAAALAPLAGLAAAIPAVALGAVAAFGALKLALSGVGDAFKTALGDDAEKFEESLKGLTPAAQSVARELRALRPQLMGIRDAAQSAFFGPLQGQLRATAGVLAGPLKAGVKDVAGQYGAAAREALAFTRESRTVSTLRTVFDSVTASLAKIRPAITPVLRGFRDMAAAGASSITQMAGGLGDAGARFGQWMQEFAASGGVQQAIGGAVDLLKTLGGLLKNLGGIFASIGQAASQAGGGIFGVLTQITGQLNAFLKTAAGQQGLQSLFQIFNSIGQAIAPIVPIIGHVIGALATALAPVIQALVPIVNLLVDAFGRIIRSLTPILAPLGAVIAQLLIGLMPILSPMIDLLAQTAQQIGGALVQALTASLPSLQEIVLAIASLLPELMPLVPLWAEWLVTILPLVPILLTLAATLVGYLVPVIRIVIQVVMRIWTTIAGFVIPIFQRMVQIVAWVAAQVQPVLTFIGGIFRWLGQAAMWLWTNAIQPTWNFIVAAIRVAWGILKPIFNIIATVLKVVVGGAFLILREVVKVAWIAIQVQIKIAWAIIKGIFNVIKAFISNVLGPIFRWLYEKVIRPVWNGISSVISWVWRNGIKPAFDKVKSAVRAVRDAFQTAVDGIKRIWDRLQGIAKKPVNFVIDLYNNGIANLVNKIAKVAGIDTRLSTIPKFASGGIMPGYSPGVDSLIAAVSPGEAIMRPEFTRAVGSGFVSTANDVARRSGVDGVRKWLTGPDAMGGEGLAFARGGIVPRFAGHYAFGGIIGRFVDGVKNFTIGNVAKGAKGLLDKILGGAVPGAGMLRDVIAQIPAWIKDNILKWIKSKVDSFGGGPGISRAVSFARAQAGKPYVWGGVGPGGYDCSGFMSALTNVIQGKNPYSRRFTTHGFTGPTGPAGFVRGARSGFTVGITHGGVGHMAGTLGGKLNVESRGSAGVVVGAGARGTSDGLFSTRYGLKFDRGGMLQPGFTLAYNATGKPEPVLTSGQFDALAGSAAGADGPLVTIGEVVVKERADVDLLADRLGFTVRAAAF